MQDHFLQTIVSDGGENHNHDQGLHPSVIPG